MRSLLFYFLPLLALASCDRKPAPAPPPDAIKHIHVITPTAWWLRINPDGSGEYGHGAESGPSATIPPATYDADELARAIDLRALDSGNITDHYAVVLLRAGDTAVATRYLKTPDLVIPLFERARSRRTSADAATLAKLDELWKSAPPVEERPANAVPEVIVPSR